MTGDVTGERSGTAAADRPGRSVVVDAGVVVVVLLGCLPAWFAADARTGPVGAVVVFGVLSAVIVAGRRRFPVATVVAVAALLVVAAAVGVRFTPFVSNAGLGWPVAVFTLADRRPWRVSVPWSVGAAVTVSAATVVALFRHPGQDQDAVVLLLGAAAWWLGYLVRTRRHAQRDLAAERAARVREREESVRTEERLRISREVHDVVSHSLTVVALRSGVARLLIDTNPDETRAALTAIEQTSRGALAELRAVLRSTRAAAAGTDTADGAAGCHPAGPGLDELTTLVAGVDATGPAVALRIDGPSRRYPASLELVAYRIVQEALTNTVRHAMATHVEVVLAHGDHTLSVTVADDGRPAPRGAASAGTGSGLAGLRDRVAAVDGRFTAGPAARGGFRVAAVLPVVEAAP